METDRIGHMWAGMGSFLKFRECDGINKKIYSDGPTREIGLTAGLR